MVIFQSREKTGDEEMQRGEVNIMGKSLKIKSSHIRFGRRTYFFDVNQSENKRKYLRITESKFEGEGKPRIYNSFLLFPEEVVSFQKSLGEVVGLLH